jgi:hypothetical protein
MVGQEEARFAKLNYEIPSELADEARKGGEFDFDFDFEFETARVTSIFMPRT